VTDQKGNLSLRVGCRRCERGEGGGSYPEDDVRNSI